MKRYKRYQLGGFKYNFDPMLAQYNPYNDPILNKNKPLPAITDTSVTNPIPSYTPRTVQKFNYAPLDEGGNKGSFLSGVSRNAGAIMPFISNIANSFRTLPKPPKPVMENEISANLVNYDADRNELNRTQAGINKGLAASSANPSFANAQRAAMLGRFLEAKGRISQQERNTNAAIKNQTRQFNQGVKARNTERENAYNNEQTQRILAQQQLQGQNLANFADKFQMMNRDKKMMELERERLEIIPRTYADTGVVGRNINDLIEADKERQRNFGLSLMRNNRYGGKIAAIINNRKRHA